ncbi:MAG: hypothetical protein P4L84_07020 [Isosphaeraceae bacterium]|nr:hypothetical protein [Isosphaeraceae bacterium]
MPAQTEAACLLESGALYAKRLILKAIPDSPIFAGFKTGAFSLYFGDAPIFHFDLEGRWQRAYASGLHYLKGLDGSVQTIDRVREGKNLVLKRRTLGYAEASDFDASVRTTALELLDMLGARTLERVGPPAGAEPVTDDELKSFLERIVTWDSAAWFSHRERYLDTYGHLPFLPPDCPHAVILQATLGHAGGRAFGLGHAHEHDVRSAGEFEQHARAVAKLLGRRLEQCKGVFLAGADALRRPESEVTGFLETIRTVFGTTARNEDAAAVHSFLDGPPGPGPERSGWRRYADLGLRRVTVGVESGSPEVRALYGKTWQNGDLRSLVADLKAAGIGVGLLAIVGAGGIENAERHLGATVALLNELEVGPGDLISLVDARELAGGEALGAHGEPLFSALTGAAWSGQLSALKSGLSPLRSSRGAKVVPYSLEKQG